MARKKKREIDDGLADIEKQDKIDAERPKKRGWARRKPNKRNLGFGATIGEIMAAKERLNGQGQKTD